MATLHVSSSACNEPINVQYGNPNVLDRKSLPGEGGSEPLNCTGGGGGEGGGGGGGDGGGASGCPTFATDIFPYFTPTGKWKCSAPDCHGGASAPTIAGNDPAACLASLKAISVVGQGYISGGEGGAPDPNKSTLICNLQGSCGSKMPKAPNPDPTNAELCMLQAWIACGAN
jgi:hypothetical protein